jgi:uncharacterized protein with HEPN domain
MSSKDKANLLAIIDSIERIRNYTKGIGNPNALYIAHQAFDATLMNFINIGEMADRISAEVKIQYAFVEWQKMKDFRNLVAHDYLGIDAEEVWQIIRNDLPLLKNQINSILNSLK